MLQNITIRGCLLAYYCIFSWRSIHISQTTSLLNIWMTNSSNASIFAVMQWPANSTLARKDVRTSSFLKWLIVMTTSRKLIPHTQWAVMACHQFLFDKIEAVSQSLLQPINLCTPLPWQQLKPTTSCDNVYTILQWNSSCQLILSPLSHGPPNPDSQSGLNPN